MIVGCHFIWLGTIISIAPKIYGNRIGRESAGCSISSTLHAKITIARIDKKFAFSIDIYLLQIGIPCLCCEQVAYTERFPMATESLPPIISQD